MKEEKNITKNEMRFFQNDMLTDLKKLELQINSKLSNMSQTILSKSNEYDSKFTKIFENISELVSQVAARKYDNERVEELLSMKIKLSEQIIENQSRISILDKTLEESVYKYDKIILENLQVPGIIGIGCKFKNCRMFFDSVYNELKLNQKFKEQEQSFQKAFHEKIDSKVFKIENELNKIHQNINHVCQTKFEKYFSKIDQRSSVTENMLLESRIENSKYAEDLIKASTSLQIQWDRLENIKNEIYDKFYEELDIFKKIVDSTNRSFNHQEDEFKIFKQRFTQLADYLKDFKNQKNKYKEITKNIDFTKKQKLDNNYDMTNYDKIGDDVKEYIRSPSPIKNKATFNFNTENKINRKQSFSSISSLKKIDNIPGMSPKNSRRNSLKEDKKFNIELQTMKKNKMPKKRMSNFNVKSNIIKDNNIKIKTMTEIKSRDKNDKLLNQNIGKSEQKKDNSKKTFLKIIKKKKTIVTENNIDLNFESKKNFNKINEKNISKEDDNEEDEELLSVGSENSSNFSMSSMGIVLNKLPQQENEDNNKKNENNKGKKKYIDKGDIKEKEKENNKEKRNSNNIEKPIKNIESKEITNSFEKINKEIMNNMKKISIIKNENNNEKKKLDNKEKNIENDNSEKRINELKENLNDIKNYKKMSGFPVINENNNKEKINVNNDNINNNKNITNINRYNSKDSNIKDIKNNETPNIDKEKIIEFYSSKSNFNNVIQNSRINLHKNKIIQNNSAKNNKDEKIEMNELNKSQKQLSFIEKIEEKDKNSLLMNDESKSVNKNKVKKFQSICILDQNKRLQLTEYNNFNKNNLNKKNSMKINQEITFPQIKTISNDFSKKDENKLTEIAQQTTNTTNMATTKSEIRRKISQKFKRNQINTNNLLLIAKKSSSKEENQNKKFLSSNIIDNLSIKNETKDLFNSNNNVFNAIEKAKKEIKNINKENNNNDNINNNNAFLTSLNNINNNYNYYYNNNLNDNSNIINILNNKNINNDEKMNKFHNRIDFINKNIKSVNQRINVLEDRYKLILNQLNNIYKIVSSHYYHHKKRSNSKKDKINTPKKEDLLNNIQFMHKIRELYNDNDFNLKIPNDEFKKAIKKIEPFLIQKFKKNQ